MSGAYQGNADLDTTPNTSGRGPAAELPTEVGRLNWGAFLLNWIWGLGNGTYIALLSLVPIVNFVMPFVLLFKGDKWAWQNTTWRDVRHFRSVQTNWAIAGAVVYGLGLFFVIVPIVAVVVIFSSVGPFDDVKEEARLNPQIAEIVGTPVEVGWFTSGSVSQQNQTGDADVSASVRGPLASGSLRMVSTRENGVWVVRKLVLTLDETGQAIAITPGLR